MCDPVTMAVLTVAQGAAQYQEGVAQAQQQQARFDANRLAANEARDRAISSAFKVVSSRMQSDRNRTASRAEASEKRNAKGTKNVSNTQKLIGG